MVVRKRRAAAVRERRAKRLKMERFARVCAVAMPVLQALAARKTALAGSKTRFAKAMQRHAALFAPRVVRRRRTLRAETGAPLARSRPRFPPAHQA
jgi:hypothetical protein